MLFNAAAARKAAHERAGVIVAEGYMDVIAFERAGFANAVAPLGTALTPEQLTLLWRMADEPLLCFDGDAAGIKAAYRAVETALPHLTPGKSLAFVFLPEGLDPDDLLRQRGPDAVSEALRASRPLVDVLWAKELSAGDWSTPERRAQFEQRLRELIQTIGDRTVRQYYDQEIRRRLREKFNAYRPQAYAAANRPRAADRFGEGANRRQIAGGFLGAKRGPMQQFAGGATSALTESAMVRTAGADVPIREALIVKTVLNHPWLLDDNAEEIMAVRLECGVLERLRDAILTAYSGQNPLDKDGLRYQLEKLGYSGLLAQIEHAITHNSDWNTQPDASRDDVLVGWRHRLALHRKSELKRELESAERALAIDPSEENFLKLQDLFTQVWSADGTELAADGGKDAEP
jgi:DNA primase